MINLNRTCNSKDYQEQQIIQKRCGIIDRKARNESDRFSIFFRGCNQYKFIHITGTKVETFLRHKGLYLKKKF